MKDTFGNYVLQKIFEHGTLSQKQRLAETMEDSMVSLTFDQYGCRVVQKVTHGIGPVLGSLLTLSLTRCRPSNTCCRISGRHSSGSSSHRC